MPEFIFLDSIPPEIRNHVYSYVIASIDPLRAPRRQLHKPATSTSELPRFREDVPPLFQTCKQIWKESRGMLLDEITFRLEVDLDVVGFTASQELWIRSIGKVRAAKFRHITVSLDCRCLRESLWHTYCWNLTELGNTSRDQRLDGGVMMYYLGSRKTSSVVASLAESGFKREQVQIVAPSEVEHTWLKVENLETRYVFEIFKRWSEQIEEAWDRREQRARKQSDNGV